MTSYPYYWKRTSNLRTLPNGAVEAGRDMDGAAIYVGRSKHSGETLPAKMVPSRAEAYVCYNGNETKVSDCEVLCGNFRWISSRGIPHSAVEGGVTCDGEVLFIGRTRHNGVVVVGKVHPSHDCLYVPFDGKEIKFQQYEILTRY